MNRAEIYQGDCLAVLRQLPEESVNCVVTSPPYWGLRDYGVEGQLGLEPTPEAHVENMVQVFREVRRILRRDGTLWLNYGDSYASRTDGSHGGWNGDSYDDGNNPQRTMGDGTGVRLESGLKPKDLVGMPWRVAFALQADGWWLRSDIIWHKPNPMPESVTDRPTKAHEYVFLLTKSAKYFYDADAVRTKTGKEADPEEYQQTDGRRHFHENDAKQGMQQYNPEFKSMTHPLGRNLRTVWTIPTDPQPEAHFATFPRKLVSPCVRAGCPHGGVVLDPFMGSGTTLLVSCGLGRAAIGIELNPEYIEIAKRRLDGDMLIDLHAYSLDTPAAIEEK